MMTLDEMNLKLEATLTPKRYKHSLGVMETSLKLAERYGADREKAATAGLLHDCARDIKGEALFELCSRKGIVPDEVSKYQPELLHGRVGSALLQEEYGVTDGEIREAVEFHTTGNANMSLLSKIVLLADYIEPGRTLTGLSEIRREAYYNIDRAIIMVFDRTINYVVSKGALLHPDTLSARNTILISLLYGEGGGRGMIHEK